MIVLDSTVLIDYLRGTQSVQRVHSLARSGITPATTAVNVEEIARGLRPGEERAARDLFDGLVLLGIDRACAEVAGRWRREHAARGTALWQADCLIAAATALAGATLATANVKDFPMEELSVELWPSGR